MAVKKFNTRIQLKRDTSTNFASFSPLAGELLVVTDKNNVKIGDGSNVFADLPYLVGGATLASYTAPAQDLANTTITNGDTLDQALAKLQKAVDNAAAGGVQSIGGATGAVILGNGLYSAGGANGSVSTVTAGYIVNNAGDNNNAIAIDSSKIDSTYHTNGTVNTGTNLATVATVTAALGTLDVTAFSQAAITTTAGSGASTLTINGISETDGKIATDSGTKLDIAIDGEYDASTNKIATESTVSDVVADLDVAEYAQASLTANGGVSVLTIKGIKEVDGEIAASSSSADTAVQIDGNYDASTNKIATQTTVSTAVTNAVDGLDVTGYAQAEIDTTTTGQTTFTVKGIKEEDGEIAADSTANVDLVIDGEYDVSTNKIATQSTVQNAINNALDSEVTFKGIAATQPASPENGDMWKASGAITVNAQDDGQGAGFTTKAGDTIIYKYDSAQGATGNGWYLIPSADDVEDTWRPVNVGGSELLGSGISTGAVNFAGAQDNPVTVTGSGNTVTVQHGTITAPTAPTATSKTQGQTVTAITDLTEDGYGHVTAYTTDSFTIPTVNDGALTINGASGGPITVAPTGTGYTANSASGETYTITHAAKPTTLTPAAVKVAVDNYGHAQTGDALTSTDIATVSGDPQDSTNPGTTVSSSLQELATRISNVNEAGTLDTTSTSPIATNSPEDLGGAVQLHKVAKTGTITDLYQAAPETDNGITNTVDLVIFDCGTATVNTNNVSA